MAKKPVKTQGKSDLKRLVCRLGLDEILELLSEIELEAHNFLHNQNIADSIHIKNAHLLSGLAQKLQQ